MEPCTTAFRILTDASTGVRMATIESVTTREADGAVVGCLTLLESLIEEEARDLVAKLTAWLDAPRLAARATPTVAMAHGGVELIQTTANEWGVRYDPGAPVEWTDEPTARAEFVRESRIGQEHDRG